jgi:hypothetical protein
MLTSDPELIYLTDGASKGVMQLLNVIIRDEKDGVCIFAFSSSRSVCFFLGQNSYILYCLSKT